MATNAPGYARLRAPTRRVSGNNCRCVPDSGTCMHWSAVMVNCCNQGGNIKRKELNAEKATCSVVNCPVA